MSKKTSKSWCDNYNNSLTQAIQQYMDGHEESGPFQLACMARALNVANSRVYSSAKTPIAGVAYNPDVYNWDALERFVLRRLAPNETMDEFVARVYGIQGEISTNRISNRNRRITVTDPDGTERVYPGRRFSYEPQIGEILHFKDDTKEYKVCMVTPTHVVAAVENSPELVLLSNWTFNAKVILPEKTEAAAEEAVSNGIDAGVTVEQ